MKRLAAVPATIAIIFAVLASMASHFSAYGRVSRVFHLFWWLLLLTHCRDRVDFLELQALADLHTPDPVRTRIVARPSLAVVVVLRADRRLSHVNSPPLPRLRATTTRRCEADAKRREPIGSYERRS